MERRRDTRKTGSQIPAEYRTLILEFESGDIYEGTVRDISQNGMSVDIPVAPNRIHDFLVTIYTKDKSKSATEEIANFSSSGDGGSRLGILFSGENVFFDNP